MCGRENIYWVGKIDVDSWDIGSSMAIPSKIEFYTIDTQSMSLVNAREGLYYTSDLNNLNDQFHKLFNDPEKKLYNFVEL